MTSKQRAYLKGLAMTMEPIFQIGKYSSSGRGFRSKRADKNQCTPELYG